MSASPSSQSIEGMQRTRLVKSLNELVDASHHSPALNAVIGERQIVVVTVPQCLNQMRTTWRVHLPGPLHLECSCFSLCHVPSSSSLGHLCRQVGFTQAHMRNGGMVILRAESVQVMNGLAFWL